MKQVILALAFSFCAAFSVNAQSSETVSRLTPVPSNIGKFSKNQLNNKLKFDVKAEPVDLPGGKKGIAVTVQARYWELVFEDRGGLQTSILRIYLRITSDDKKTDGFFEERVETQVEREELVDLKEKRVTFRRVFELPAGKYQVGVIGTDMRDGYRNAKIVKFQIGAGI